MQKIRAQLVSCSQQSRAFCGHLAGAVDYVGSPAIRMLSPCSSGSMEFNTTLLSPHLISNFITWSQTKLSSFTPEFQKNAEGSIIANTFKISTCESPYTADSL